MTTQSRALPHKANDCGSNEESREKIIKIHYADNETGPAQLLTDRLAVIMEPAILVNLWEGDLVRLSDHPLDYSQGFPRIEEVITKRHCKNTVVDYHDDSDLETLTGIFKLLDAEVQPLSPPTSEAPGTMLVGHHHSVDALFLAEVIGIDQSRFEHDDSEEDEADESR